MKLDVKSLVAKILLKLAKNVFVTYGVAETNINWVNKGGVYAYNTSTEGRPSSYGMLLHISTYEGLTGWHWQLAFTTDNAVLVRCNINPTSSNFGGNWSNWKGL